MNVNRDGNETRLKTAHSIFFVCYGNVCRSPMAEGLAKQALDDSIRIESAGLSPVLDRAAEEAILVMKELFGVDISEHMPRNITETSFRDFDLIVVLDAYVHKTLKRLASELTDKLVLWDIEDPYGSDLAVYRQVAEKIWDKIQNHLR